MIRCAEAADVGVWSGVGAVKGEELSSVVRSTIENVSSPTLLMRDVMRSVRDVVGRDAVVVAALAVPAITDTPLIPVTSNAVIARTESFLRFIIFIFNRYGMVLKYMECYIEQYFRDSTYRDWEFPKNEILGS